MPRSINMKNIIVLILGILLNTSILADIGCFIAKENGVIIKQEGECVTRRSLCSTFKIVISLIGYNEGILLDATHPVLLFKPGYIDQYETWRQPQNPTTWLKNSCIWFSQVITQKLGIHKFKDYLAKFNYGNKDVSGDKGQNNGLTSCWLSSSLQVSPIGQITLLEKLVTNKLPVSKQAQEFTQVIMYVETLSNGWKLYGKTGGGYKLNNSGVLNKNNGIGWFVGWVEKDDHRIIFANYLETNHKVDIPLGIEAKTQTMEKLMQLIDIKK